MSEHEANTNEVLYSKHNINHEEGGWPKDVDYAEAEHTIRFRKKVEKDEDYINTVVRLGTRVEERLMQNNAIDIYQHYFAEDVADMVAEVCSQAAAARCIMCTKQGVHPPRALAQVTYVQQCHRNICVTSQCLRMHPRYATASLPFT